MKKQRHNVILNLIDKYDIGTQEDLCAMLLEAGYDVTQATVSRDIRELKLIKVVAENGSQKYVRTTNEMAIHNRKPDKNDLLMREVVKSVDYAGNLIVIKASAGMGSAVGATIDDAILPNVLGTVAGDDTLLCVMRSEEAAAELTRQIKKMILEY